jgi:hypothetical protein
VKKGVGVGSGVKIGFGMFIVLPMLLFFAGCLAVLAFLATATSQYQGYKQQARERVQAEKKATPDVMAEFSRAPRLVPTMGLGR